MLNNNKEFYRSLIAISLPITLQNLISFSINMLDTVMIGMADKTGVMLSAASLANQPFFLLSVICFGFAGAAGVLNSQYWGKKDVHTIRIVMSMVLKAALLVSVLFCIFAAAFPEQVMKLYSGSSDVIKQGAVYLRILAFTYPVFGLSNTMICMLRNIECVKISVVINIVSLFTNLTLNYILIFGKLGFPALYIKGAAIATLITRLLEFIILWFYVFKFEKRLRFQFTDFFKYNKLYAIDLVKYGLPVLINESMWALAVSLQASILGHIKYSQGDPVGANAIASMLQQLAMITMFGIAASAAVTVGKAIGEKDMDTCIKRARTFKYISYITGLAALILILSLKNIVVDFYDFPEATIILAKELIIVVGIVTFFSSITAIHICGTFRGAGDTRFCLVTELSALWLVALPLGFLAANVFKLPVPIVLLLMKIDEPLKAVICLIRLKGNKWIKDVTRS